MATGAPGSNGVWVYGEDDSEATFSALLNKAASTTNTQLGLDRARLATLELSGRVVQVVQSMYSTPFTTTSTSMVDTGLTATITPRYSNSYVLALVTQQVQPVSLSNSYFMAMQIVRGSTQILFTNLNGNAGVGAGGALAINSPIHLEKFDSPATASPVTYKTQIKLDGGYRIDTQLNNNPSTITLIEVKA